jgi:hypothetical protein
MAARAGTRSTTSGSRRWSKGLSTRPTGTRSFPAPSQRDAVSPRSGSSASRRQDVQRGGAVSSGGSHTWWAGGPESRSRSSATASRLSVASSASGSGAAIAAGPERAARCTRSTRAPPAWRPGPARRAAAPAVRAGHVGGAEPGQGLDAGLEVAAAGLRGQLVGVGDAEDTPGLHRGEGAQTDPVRQVRLQLVHPALVQALRGEQQMHAEGPAEPADHHEQLHELPVRGEEFAELVDDDEQAGQRGEIGAPARAFSYSRAEV